ncbi:phosphotransferase family protein [Frondihabitans sucicola]|uniref:phosphotransferase family protein n=1 Tax=Frondihabitans sucicola TaxID=1268041 RepID=UPI002572D9BC|nr:aminoglycoside phosphotransferase family protein [Frondihabitans sucicola]
MDDDGDPDAILLDRIASRLGGGAATATELPGGFVNVTHRLRTADGRDVVVRFPRDRLRANEYPAEVWAIRAARAVGVPIAPPLEEGLEDGVPFLVSDYLHPAEQGVERPWSWLGGYARALGDIDVRGAPASLFSRFGRDLEAAWSSHVRYNRDALTPDDLLLRDGAYSAHALPFLRRQLDDLSARRFRFGLAHGDLAPRNLLSRGADQPPVLLDWGAATTGPTPWTDAQRVFEWAFCERTISRSAYEEFAAAAGVNGPTDERTLLSMVVLHLLDVTRWAHDRRPDLYDDYVARCRSGLDILEALV